jgi:hypothetical protein
MVSGCLCGRPSKWRYTKREWSNSGHKYKMDMQGRIENNGDLPFWSI